jgi:hypothetical protein
MCASMTRENVCVQSNMFQLDPEWLCLQVLQAPSTQSCGTCRCVGIFLFSCHLSSPSFPKKCSISDDPSLHITPRSNCNRLTRHFFVIGCSATSHQVVVARPTFSPRCCCTTAVLTKYFVARSTFLPSGCCSTNVQHPSSFTCTNIPRLLPAPTYLLVYLDKHC